MWKKLQNPKGCVLVGKQHGLVVYVAVPAGNGTTFKALEHNGSLDTDS